MKWIENRMGQTPPADPKIVGRKEAGKARDFHRSIPSYAETPLAELSGLARTLGLGHIYVKDESYRFGINSFKGLGGAYAIGTYLAHRLGSDIRELPYETMISPEIRKQLGEITFVSTTDGNHGRGVAWTAQKLGQKCVIFMPKGSSPERLAHIRALGAEATITDLNYDDTIRMAAALAEKNGWVTVQDKDWEGYTDIPLWIMQGYAVMALECFEALEARKIKPTHVFLQAGVGSMAAAVTGLLADVYGADRPKVIIIESDQADCYYRTAAADDGSLHLVSGEMDTIMAGLACGEPTNLGWPILRDHTEGFISLEDPVTATGMRILAAPVPGDPRVISGESGAVGVGLCYHLMLDERYKDLRTALAMDADSAVLCFSTEGDTDRNNYRKIVWEGAWAKEAKEKKGKTIV
ncbi:MAG: diaminopropionate ammonia-lyase [Clostridiales bacterium]|nr:diaminopropionate ammonia-lyase [Clostridiales bacterium]